MVKFSLDKELKCMLPIEVHRRKPHNEASWKGFWMTDAELENLVREIMTDYQQYQPQWAQRNG